MKEGWEMKKLGEVYDVRDGTHDSPKYQSEGFPLITSKNLKNGIVTFEKIKFISEEDYININKRSKVDIGDVLFAMIGTIGNPTLIISEPNYAIKNVALFKVGNLQSSQYLKYYLESPYTIDKMLADAKGSTQRFVGLGYLRKFPIPIPPLPEQKKIVTLLDAAFAKIDQAKANIEKNIENAKELFDSKKGDYFEKLALENELTSINDACEKIFAGGDKPKKNFSKTPTQELNIPIIANAVKDNGLYGYTNVPKVTKPSITVAARGSGTGHTEFRNYPFVPIVRLIVLTPNTEIVNVEFLMHAIKSLTISRTGSAIPQLTVPMMKGYSIPIPSKEKQTEIVENLNQLEAELRKYKATSERKISDLEQLKKALLQKAFAGELT